MQNNNIPENNTEEQITVETNVSTPVDNHFQQNNSVKKRFEVEIFDKISVGEPPYDSITLEKVHFEKPVVIEAASKKDLQDFAEKLSLCNQTFKIVKVLDDVPVVQSNINTYVQTVQNTQVNNTTQTLHTSNMKQNDQQIDLNIEKNRPKYYTVAGISIKEQNGKVYQKQWIKLNDNEASQIRVVNNLNNKILKLDNKHIEVLKWIEIQKNEKNDINFELN